MAPVTPQHTLSHTNTHRHTLDQAENHHLSNVSVSITETIVWWRAESETDKNQQNMSDCRKQWNKTGHGKDTAAERRTRRRRKKEKKRKRRKSVEASQMKKVATLRQNTQTRAHNSRQRAERVNLSLTPLASCTRTLFFSPPNNYFCLSNTLLFHCLLLYFHEKPVTDVIAYQRAKHYIEMITLQSILMIFILLVKAAVFE